MCGSVRALSGAPTTPGPYLRATIGRRQQNIAGIIEEENFFAEVLRGFETERNSLWQKSRVQKIHPSGAKAPLIPEALRHD
jgi:hypothetical protein